MQNMLKLHKMRKNRKFKSKLYLTLPIQQDSIIISLVYGQIPENKAISIDNG